MSVWKIGKKTSRVVYSTTNNALLKFHFSGSFQVTSCFNDPLYDVKEILHFILQIPSREIDKTEEKFWTYWNEDTKQVTYKFIDFRKLTFTGMKVLLLDKMSTEINYNDEPIDFDLFMSRSEF